MSFDLWLLQCIHTMHCLALDNIMVAITYLGNDGLIWLAVGIFLLFFRRWRAWGILLLVTLGLGTLLGQGIIKPLVARPRPFIVDPTLPLLISAPTDFSFPSGHTLSSFAAAFIIWQIDRRWGCVAYIVASLIAFSRLFVGVHYPTDVLAGAAIGTAIAWLTCYLAHKFLPRYFNKKEAM